MKGTRDGAQLPFESSGEAVPVEVQASGSRPASRSTPTHVLVAMTASPTFEKYVRRLSFGVEVDTVALSGTPTRWFLATSNCRRVPSAGVAATIALS